MINDLLKTFNEAADKGDAKEEFESLMAAYKATFGDKFELLVDILYHHHSANFYDYLHEYRQNVQHPKDVTVACQKEK